MFKKASLVIFVLILSQFSSATEISPLIGGNFTFGGEALAYVVFTDGSQSDLKAGRGLTFFGGASFDDIWSKNENFIDIQTTLGVKYASTKAALNGEIAFTRWPIEAIVFYRNTDYKLRAGAGLSYHFANKITGTDALSALSAQADNALGFVMQADYLMGFNSQMALGLRYENISYKIKNQSFTASGNNLGIQFTYMWKSS